MVKRPSLFYKKNLRNLRFHFDMMHGEGNLHKAIKLLDDRDRKDFDNFVNTEVSSILTTCLFANPILFRKVL